MSRAIERQGAGAQGVTQWSATNPRPGLDELDYFLIDYYLDPPQIGPPGPFERGEVYRAGYGSFNRPIRQGEFGYDHYCRPVDRRRVTVPVRMQNDNRDRDDRRGGGRHRGHNNNNSRKRRHDGEDDYQNDRGGAQRRRQDNGPPRRTFEEAPLAKIRRLLLNIASSSRLPQDEAIEIAEAFSANYNDDHLRNAIFDITIQLIIEQPFRTPFVAAVALYSNDVNPDITAEALKRVTIRAQESLHAGEWKNFKLLLRFLACLQSLFDGDGVFTFLGQLFDTVVDLQSANENDVVGIELVKIILLTIPYALVAGGSEFHGQAQALLRNTGIVASNMLPIEGLIHAYTDDSEDVPIAYHSVIGLLQTQLENEAANGWNFACIFRFNPNALRKPEDSDSMPVVPKTHQFPSFTIPSPVNPGTNALFPEAYFSLYGQQEIQTVPDTTDIAASLIRDVLVDTIDQLDFNREGAAKFLIDADCYWSVDTFAKRNIPFDQFKEAIGEKAVWKSEDMVIDAIFSQLLKLPSPQHKLVYYHSLITECCKVAPAAIAPSLGRAIRSLYRSLDIIDLELAYRFLDWFAHHTSNFDFRWRWAEWVEDLPLSNLQPKKAFIIAAVDKEIRLSFAKRIRSTIPQEMQSLITVRLDEDNSPGFKYEDLDTPFAAEGQQLLLQLRKKASDADMQATINKIHEQAAEHGIGDVFVPSTDAFVTAICRLGAKSLSHVRSIIDRVKERLREFANQSDAASRQIVGSVIEYWKDHPGVAVHIIDVLMNYSVLSPLTVLEWVFGDYLGAGEALTKAWVFEIVSITVRKVTGRNLDIVKSRFQEGLPQDQVAMLDATLTKERDNARKMFKYIEDQVGGVAGGASDTLMEKEMNGELSDEHGQLIRAWAKRWHRVFLRKTQVAESVVGEEAVEARIRLLAAEADAEPEPMQEENGVGEGVANGDEEMH